jgi:hypothetical protein
MNEQAVDIHVLREPSGIERGGGEIKRWLFELVRNNKIV